jgi:hypothetical protein
MYYRSTDYASLHFTNVQYVRLKFIFLNVFLGAGMGGWQQMVLDVVAIFGISKCGCVQLYFSNHIIATSNLSQLS